MKITNLFLTESEQEVRAVESAIGQVLGMSVTSHFWHWQTKSYAAHKAFDEFYNAMTDFADQIAEQYMGAGHEFKTDITTEMSADFSIEGVQEKLKSFKNNLVQVETNLMHDENGPMHGVADTIIDVIKAVDKLQYLLTLK